MAKRKFKKRIRIDSEEVQGKDSYVVIRTPTFHDFKDMNVPENKDDKDVMINFGMEMLSNLIEKWNWVDDEDKPLDLPTTENNVVQDLPLQEIMFLMRESKLDQIADQKN